MEEFPKRRRELKGKERSKMVKIQGQSTTRAPGGVGAHRGWGLWKEEGTIE